ncbi:PhnD/SsuA/transferrin family substrate-binding protein [Roseomonas sp. OT10]|uniref:PhnD/SsuA/transferrin family substrate-binding protein n=1 Tax=Roseomonas cutis TaxID=2897332 RepID=UPI001E324224|nr:PhnD/SsuA/transferrin family substrate-binding protein [Roseomonas sp. OT10]UFN47707.1 PhnD/SsuA/transferrin family substrate-binding protein [Roseomonas sp. OT10]
MRTTSLSRRAALAGLGGTLLAVPSLAVGSGLSGVTLRVADQAGATRSKLAAAGLLDDVPYRIEWSVFAAAVNIHEALKAGAVDLGMAGSGPTIAALAGGSRVRIVAGWDTGGRETYLLVPPDSPVRRLEELRGRTVSPTGRGSAGHLIVVNALESVGLSAADVKLAFLSPADAGAAFSSGSIDAWGIWSTYAYRALGTRKARAGAGDAVPAGALRRQRHGSGARRSGPDGRAGGFRRPGGAWPRLDPRQPRGAHRLVRRIREAGACHRRAGL